MLLGSQTVRPDELLGDGVLGQITELFEEGTLLHVNVEAVAEAHLLLTDEHGGLDSERILDLGAAPLEARDGVLTHVSRELHGLEGLLDLSLFGFDFLVAVGFASLLH